MKSLHIHLKILFFLSAFCLAFPACKQIDYKIEKFESFCVQIPKTSTVRRLRAIESIGYSISLQDSTKINILYGENIYDLSQPKLFVYDTSRKSIFKKFFNDDPKEKNYFFSESPERDEDENLNSPNYYYMDTINQLVVRHIKPKKIGTGITGIYLKKISGRNSLTIYSVDVNTKSQAVVDSILNSLRRI